VAAGFASCDKPLPSMIAANVATNSTRITSLSYITPSQADSNRLSEAYNILDSCYLSRGKTARRAKSRVTVNRLPGPSSKQNYRGADPLIRTWGICARRMESVARCGPN
jgi:hypothetical protein